MRNRHGWKTRDAEGRRREVRARLFGKRWTVEARCEDADDWTSYEEPPLGDLIHLRRILFNKYHRHHVSWEHVASVEKLIRARGGSWEE